MLNKLAIRALRWYKATLSRVKGKRCIYTPSCSVYAIEAYSQYNFVQASLLTAKRLLSCAPWGKGGIDYVPYNKKGLGKYYL